MFRPYKKSPKSGTLYQFAEVVSQSTGNHGQWIVTVMLDETHFETVTYWGYSKREALRLCKAEYGIA